MNYIDSIVKICIRVIPTASALPLSTHVKSNVMRSKPTFALRTRIHGAHTSRTSILSTAHSQTQQQHFCKTKFHLNNEIITVRSKPWQTVLVDQKQSIFSNCPDTGPLPARWGKNACGNLIAPRSIWNSAQAGCM